MASTSQGTGLRARWVLAVAATAALCAPACVPNDNVFFIVQNQLPMSGGIGSQCIVPSDPGAAFLNNGVLDVALRSQYVMTPLYRSELLSYRDPNAGRAETRALFVDGADVELRVVSPGAPLDSWPRAFLPGPGGGAPLSPTYTVVSTSFVPPATQSGPGYGAGFLEIIPSNVGASLASRVCLLQPGNTCPRLRLSPDAAPLSLVAIVRPFGHTVGGLQIQGAAFNFPITVCCGCLVSFPAEARSSPTATDCNSTMRPTQIPCVVGQNEPVDCRLCSGSNDLCQPPC